MVTAAGTSTQPSTTTEFATSSEERLVQVAQGEERDMRAPLPGNRLVKAWLGGYRGARLSSGEAGTTDVTGGGGEGEEVEEIQS